MVNLHSHDPNQGVNNVEQPSQANQARDHHNRHQLVDEALGDGDSSTQVSPSSNVIGHGAAQQQVAGSDPLGLLPAGWEERRAPEGRASFVSSVDPFSLTTGVVGLTDVALKLVTSARGTIDQPIAAHKEVTAELNKLQGDLEDLQEQMVRIHTLVKEWAKDQGFKKLLQRYASHGSSVICGPLLTCHPVNMVKPHAPRCVWYLMRHLMFSDDGRTKPRRKSPECNHYLYLMI